MAACGTAESSGLFRGDNRSVRLRSVGEVQN